MSDNLDIPRLAISFDVISARFVTYSHLLMGFINEANAADNLSTEDIIDLNSNINDAITNLTAIKTKVTNAITLLNGAIK